MTDYNKLTVVQIRELFKTRGIPATGLTKKAQLIERLQEADAAGQLEQNAANTQVASANGVTEPAATNLAGETGQNDEHKSTLTTNGSSVTSSTANQAPTELSPVVPAPSIEPKIDVAPEALHSENVDVPSTAPGQSEASPGLTMQDSLAVQSHSTNISGPIMSDATQTVDSVSSLSQSVTGEDTRKRKRRSQSPVPAASEVAAKKLKNEDRGGDVYLNEDKKSAEPNQEKTSVVLEEDATARGPIPPSGDDKVIEPADFKAYQDKTKESGNDKAPESEQKDAPAEEKVNFPASIPIPTDSHPAPNKFKELFHPKPDSPSTLTPSHITETENDEDDDNDRIVPPSRHPATCALYIRDIMRPLVPGTFRAHLTKLARPKLQQPQDLNTTPPASDTAPSTFYLDTIRTHCFAIFPSISTASRVRNALHGRIYPPERDRKPLSVDFVPEASVAPWIAREAAASDPAGRAGPRWEVRYAVDAETGETRAALSEADAPLSATTGPGVPAAAPPGAPAALAGRKAAPLPPSHAPLPVGRAKTPPSFRALDARFRSTRAKPKLYYLPAPAEVAHKRTAALQRVYARRGAAEGGEMRRYTFEKVEEGSEAGVVDDGPEFGLRAAERGGFRGGRGRGGRGGYAERPREREREGFGGDRGDRGGYGYGGRDRDRDRDRERDRERDGYGHSGRGGRGGW